MDSELYRATTEGEILEFIRAMEQIPADGTQYNPPATCVQLGPQKNTVLHIATSFEHYEIVKLICKDLPFLVAEKNAKGDTALHIAARAGNSSLVGFLLDCDFKEVLSEQNEDGNTALHEALCYRHEEVARMLIVKNRNMSYCVNKIGKSLLYLAAEVGYAAIVKLLLENPVGNYSLRGSCKYNSPVHAAILGRNIDVLKVLWEKDQSSFHLRCKEGRNPLHHAAYIGYVEGVNFLLNKSCTSAYQRDKRGLFPIHLASRKGHTTIIQEMLHYCPDSRELLTLQFHNILHVAAKSGKAQAVTFMLKMFELQKLLNERDGDGNTPLHVATIYGNAKTVSTLTWDERVNLELENNEGFTALDIAEKYMETTASFRKRLTWMALKVAGAPRAQRAKVSKRKKPIVGEQPKMENHRDKVNVILLVATLVATVTFTAGFTVPGGYNNSDPQQGLATMLAKVKFQVFVICDTIAMYSSITVAVTLIWAQLGNLNSMQIALKLALPVLGLALAMMSIAFMAGVYLAVSKLSWLANVVLFMGTTFVLALVTLFVPLCCLASSHYQIFRCISYYPFCLMLYAFSYCTDHYLEG